MKEITTPIVTITLVLAAVFVPVAFMPGMTGRLYNQFAMTIVFSFVFSAFNSLSFSPAMSRLFLRPRGHGESTFFLFRWFNRAMRWAENSYDAFLDRAARDWARRLNAALCEQEPGHAVLATVAVTPAAAADLRAAVDADGMAGLILSAARLSKSWEERYWHASS